MSARKTRILVIQLARLGDTLQSLMALRAAKQLYPEIEITFVAREGFAPAARGVAWLDKVVTLPTDALVGPVLAGKRSHEQGVSDLARWISPLIGAEDGSPWNILLNWTYSEASSWLAGLLPADVKIGYSRRADGALTASDGWSHYIQAIVQGGVAQNIHLTDILTTQLLTALQIHVGEPTADAGNSPVTSKAFFTLDAVNARLDQRWNESQRRWIGIQLGAGQEAKSWDPERWARMASLILDRHPDCGIALLGGKGEEPLARRFMAALSRRVDDEAPVISFVGKSDFDLWASVVGQCQWLLSGDTAAIHLASVLGTRVLNVSVGPVRWSETGPYGNGHYVVAPSQSCAACESGSKSLSEHSCRDSVTPEAAYAAWSYASSEWAHRRQMTLETHFSNLGWSSELPAVHVYRSRIRSTEDGGGVVYEPFSPRPMVVNDWTAQVMGHLARAWYCGWTPPVGQELVRGTLSPQLIRSLRELDEAADVLEKICIEAVQTAEDLRTRSSKLKSDRIMRLGERQELASLGTRLTEFDSLIERLGPGHPALRAFAQLSRVLMHNLQGEQLSELGRESAESYRQIQQGCRILRDWIRQTLSLARPVAIAGAKPLALHTEA